MLDEVHERTVQIDIIMGLLKKILKKRNDLRLIISSATVDAEYIRDFFNFLKIYQIIIVPSTESTVALFEVFSSFFNSL